MCIRRHIWEFGISGHQRLRVAKELGFTEVPVSIVDVDEWEAEYLLIAENVERRGQAETDPIKKARIAQFLKEYWGVNHGGSRASVVNQHLKKTTDIANIIGESEWNTRQLMKLNDLIPEIQQLVSDGKLGTTAAEQYAYISQENQRILIDALGEKLGDKTVIESKEIRKQAESDPIKKARIATFLKEYWGVQRGNNQYSRNVDNQRSSKDIADVIGEGHNASTQTIKYIYSLIEVRGFLLYN